MKATDLFIARPILSIVLCLSIIIFGLWAVDKLAVRQYPLSDSSSVVIRTYYAGASETSVSSFVTVPIEQALGGISGVSYIQSSSARGESITTLYLIPNFDPHKVLIQVISRLKGISGRLPADIEEPQVQIESVDSKNATTFLSFKSESKTAAEITDSIYRVALPRLSSLPGIQKTQVFAEKTYAMRIWPNPLLMQAYGLRPIDIRDALQRNNVQGRLGLSDGSKDWIQLSIDSGLSSVEDFKNIIIVENEGSVIKLSDVAEVSLGSQTDKIEAWYSGINSILVGVWPSSSSNAIEVIDSVRAEIENINKQLPEGIRASVDYDSTIYIQAAIKEVLITLIETFLIVILVVALFLGKARSALIVVLTIPVSLLATSILIYFLDFSFNLLTLLAIVLSVGIIVDDTIVIIENIERRISKGANPIQAAVQGTRELFSPILVMTITLCCVFLPIAFQGGLTGSLFREFAVTLAVAIAFSGVISLFVSPALASRVLKPNLNARRQPSVWDLDTGRVANAYGRALAFLIRHRFGLAVLWLFLIGFTIYMAREVPQEFAPVEDQGIIYGIFENPPNASQEYVSHFARFANQIMLAQDETDYTFMVVGPDFGISGLITQPWEQRERSVFDILPGLQEELSNIPGLQVFPVLPPALPGGGDFPVEFSLISTGPSIDILPFAKVVQDMAAKSGLFLFPPIIDTKFDRPQITFELNRGKLADFGIDPKSIVDDLDILTNGSYIDYFELDGRSYQVIIQLKREHRESVQEILSTLIATGNGDLIPLSSVVDVSYSTAARGLNRMQLENAVTLKGVPARSLGEALEFLENAAEEILPAHVKVDYGGESRHFKLGGSAFIYTFSLALLFVFLILVVQFGNFNDPLVIFIGALPMAIFGALIFMSSKSFINGVDSNLQTTLNIYSQVGLIALVGLIAKNGILIVEFANKLRDSGFCDEQAVIRAAKSRLRPIVMTTVATVVGHFPLILVDGPGAAARNSIGLVLVGGMTVGSILALLVVPVAYTFLSPLKRTNTGLDRSLEINY